MDEEGHEHERCHEGFATGKSIVTPIMAITSILTRSPPQLRPHGVITQPLLATRQARP